MFAVQKVRYLHTAIICVNIKQQTAFFFSRLWSSAEQHYSVCGLKNQPFHQNMWAGIVFQAVMWNDATASI